LTTRRGRTLALLVLATGVGTAVYWLLVALGAFGEPGVLAWMRRFPYTSPVSDVFLTATCVAHFVAFRRGDPSSGVWGAAAAASMVYAALIAFGYLLAHPPSGLSAGHVVELLVPAYLLAFGALYLRAFLRAARRPREEAGR
jgi:hypothetical protein